MTSAFHSASPSASAVENILSDKLVAEKKDQPALLRFITCGSVDDGKSTLIGRLLYDTHLVLDDQLAALDKDSKKFGTQGQELDLALLVDGLSAEREQGITIDVAYRYFSTSRRSFIVADTPGHEQYTRNMATGASTADLAVILVDARKGILPQTRRHSFIVSMLGVRRILVAINKMDLVDFSEEVFKKISADYSQMAANLGFETVDFIPLSAKEGDNVVRASERLPWYQGKPLVAHLETIEIASSQQHDAAFQFPVQWVNRPNLDYRGFMGWVAAGKISKGAEIIALPSGQKSRIARIVTADGDLEEAVIGQSLTLTLTDEIDISRGDVIVASENGLRPKSVRAHQEITARLLATSQTSLKQGANYLIKLGTAQSGANIISIDHALDIETFESKPATELAMNGIGIAHLRLDKKLVVTQYRDNHDLGGFILIDRLTNETVAFGMIDLPEYVENEAVETIAPPTLGQRIKGWFASKGEKPQRSLVKAITWRVTGTVDTFVLSYLFTGSAKVAAAIGGSEIITKIVLYYGHERLWARSTFGLNKEK